jgi:serine/threonine protein kinase
MTSPASKTLGEYTLHEQLGAGGMGVVYRATHARLNRTAAIKLIRSGASSPGSASRFEVEARAAAKLDHPGIVSIYEIGSDGEQHFLALAYIDGETLAQRIARGPLAAEEAATLLRKICAAVVYAHEQGVIHRDLKPANILLDRSGTPFITDFGLARLESEDQSLTLEGDILGTPGYMAPEQCAGMSDEIGPATDLYSLGAVLFSMLTGFPPFQAATARETLAQVLEHEARSPRQLNSQIPRDLEAICLKCLQKDRRRRYHSVAELEKDLTAFLEGDAIVARPTGIFSRVVNFLRHESRIPQCGVLIFAFSLVLFAITAVALHERHEARTEIKVTSQLVTRQLDTLETKERQKPRSESDPETLKALQSSKQWLSFASSRAEVMVGGAMVYLLINSFVAICSLYMGWLLFTQSPTAANTFWLMITCGFLIPFVILLSIALLTGGKLEHIFIGIPLDIWRTALGKVTLLSVGGIAAASVAAIISLSSNREKFEFRRLGSRHRRTAGQTLMGARFGAPKIAAYFIMVPATLLFTAGMVALFRNILGSVLAPLRIEFVLALCLLMALALLGEYLLASRTIWALTQEGKHWKMVTRSGATLEASSAPTCYRISHLEAFLFEVTFCQLGGRVDQNLTHTNHWIILHRGQRYLFYPREPADLSSSLGNPAPLTRFGTSTDPFASTIVKPKS